MRSQGVYVAGKYVGPGKPKHGIPSTYRSQLYACRCKECCTANSEQMRLDRMTRTERLAADPSLAEHGSASTYRNWGCRCVPCSQAHSAACKAYQARRKVAQSSGQQN